MAVVREATVEDAAAIAYVHVASWRSAYTGLVPAHVLDGLSVADRSEKWRRWLSGESFGAEELGTALIAEADGSIVGFANAGPSRDDDADQGTGEVRAIYVVADAWNTGAGASLMNTALAWLRSGFTHATLWVLEGNDRGRRFYEKGGWFPDGKRQLYDAGGTELPELRYRIDF